jgi:enoyl-CoA hydratase/carnithine racemase
MCMTLACDFRIASMEAKVGFTFVKLGIHPGILPSLLPLRHQSSRSLGMGASVLLPRLIAPQKAFEYLLTGATVSGSVAKEHGLVLEAVSKEEVLPRALSLAESLSVNAPIAVQTCVTSLRADKVRSAPPPSLTSAIVCRPR